MKKNIKYIILLLIISIFGLLSLKASFAGVDIPGGTKIENVSVNIQSNGDIVESVNYLGFSILKIVKLILQGLLVIFIVYVGAQMVWSMGSDDETLSKSKRQLWYSIVALLFINMPGSLYYAFYKEDYGNVGTRINNSAFLNKSSESNMFFDAFNFGYTLGDQIVGFLEVIILAIAVVIIIYEGLKLITSRGREEKVSEAKNKIVYSILALIFVGIIEAWKNFAFSLEVSEAVNITGELADLALFFAGPVAFFFLTIAAYYYMTSAGDEERVKKAKSIVINTILATLILLAAYTFLLDLSNL